MTKYKIKICDDDIRDLPEHMPVAFDSYLQARQYLELLAQADLIRNINIYVDDEINQGFYEIVEVTE